MISRKNILTELIREHHRLQKDIEVPVHRNTIDEYSLSLAKYLIDKGVIVSSFKIGDKLYIHRQNKQNQWGVVECTIVEDADEEYIVKRDDRDDLSLPKKYIGQFIFLSRELAEEALIKRNMI